MVARGEPPPDLSATVRDKDGVVVAEAMLALGMSAAHGGARVSLWRGKAPYRIGIHTEEAGGSIQGTCTPQADTGDGNGDAEESSCSWWLDFDTDAAIEVAMV
jgi:hypothetical protein